MRKVWGSEKVTDYYDQKAQNIDEENGGFFKTFKWSIVLTCAGWAVIIIMITKYLGKL
jgi:hypothetical protein